MGFFEKGIDYVKNNPGKVALGAVGVAVGVATGGIGIAIAGTAFGIPAAGTAAMAGALGAAAGGKVDKGMKGDSDKFPYNQGNRW